MLLPEKTPIPAIYSTALLDDIEDEVDAQLGDANGMIVDIFSRKMEICDHDHTTILFLEHIDLDLLRVVAQRYLEHWIVEVRPNPNLWFQMTPKESFRQRMLAKLDVKTGVST